MGQQTSLCRISPQRGWRTIKHRCSYPFALVVDPTENKHRDLEAMLADCSNYSRWTLGDKPIVAVLLSEVKIRPRRF
jgi:hypothetical protein